MRAAGVQTWAEQRRYLGLEALKNARAVLTARATDDHDKEVHTALITVEINANAPPQAIAGVHHHSGLDQRRCRWEERHVALRRTLGRLPPALGAPCGRVLCA